MTHFRHQIIGKISTKTQPKKLKNTPLKPPSCPNLSHRRNPTSKPPDLHHQVTPKTRRKHKQNPSKTAAKLHLIPVKTIAKAAGFMVVLGIAMSILKSLMPVAVYTIEILFKTDTFNNSTMGNMIAISVGVAIGSYGEAKYDSWGVLLQLFAVLFEATALVMIQILLTSKGISLNPITSLIMLLLLL